MFVDVYFLRTAKGKIAAGIDTPGKSGRRRGGWGFKLDIEGYFVAYIQQKHVKPLELFMRKSKIPFHEVFCFFNWLEMIKCTKQVQIARISEYPKKKILFKYACHIWEGRMLRRWGHLVKKVNILFCKQLSTNN